MSATLPAGQAAIPPVNQRAIANSLPALVTIGAAAAATKLYDATTEGPMERIWVQVVNTGACVLGFNVSPSAAVYHFALKADTAANAGNGGWLDLDCIKYDISSLWVFSTPGTTLAVTKFKQRSSRRQL